MSKVLIFAGTTEGREIAQLLSESGVASDVSVATEYGSMVFEQADNICIHQGRLDEEQMRELYKETGCEIVVDATHPYAEIVTETIVKSIKGMGITYLRLLRDRGREAENELLSFYDSAASCAMALERTTGNILLTTGSKELMEFCEDEELKKRLIVRVLPGMESLSLCYRAGLEGRQIIAMQGPFSKEMNKAVIGQYDIKHLVTKESGKTGGVDTKLMAAFETGTIVHMINRPGVAESGLSMEETIEKLEALLHTKLIRGRQSITLAGIGCGSEDGLTIEVKKAIAEADYIFGAERMLNLAESTAEKYPYYRAEDILPVLDDIQRRSVRDTRGVILFSGDTGFYSGAGKLYQVLSERQGTKVNILPGISSISLLAARIGIGWQDAELISLHGVAEDVWGPRLTDAVRYNGKVFFICSGAADVRRVGEILSREDSTPDIYVGYKLSYPEEELRRVSVNELSSFVDEGLYVCAVINSRPERRTLIPYLSDSSFIRSKVPMTKEEIRLLSVAALRLRANDVLYDIGSGTGSVAIAAASTSPSVKVYSIECNEEAITLINENVQQFGLDNISVVNRLAPDGLSELTKADAAFIGGSRGNLKAIMKKLYMINPEMRIVMNAVSLESVAEMNELLKVLPVTDVKISQIAVTNINKLGDYHMMSANNPVFIYSFSFKALDK